MKFVIDIDDREIARFMDIAEDFEIDCTPAGAVLAFIQNSDFEPNESMRIHDFQEHEYDRLCECVDDYAQLTKESMKDIPDSERGLLKHDLDRLQKIYTGLDYIRRHSVYK